MENVIDAHTMAMLQRGETPTEPHELRTPKYQKLGSYRLVSRVSVYLSYRFVSRASVYLISYRLVSRVSVYLSYRFVSRVSVKDVLYDLRMSHCTCMFLSGEALTL